ncbi:MAG: ATP--guanido phosphotransferase, partial [Candidatus Latescibacteria bacterium]|nr:ATP--guanido phosphotransferase [Candidatus Latescibacterota bacterium]
MTIHSLAITLPGWLADGGPESGIVVSSRARLARNLKGYRYAHRADEETLEEIVDEVLESAESADFAPDDFFRNSVLTKSERNIFLERHLVSANLAALDGSRGVLFKDSERSSVMINEEDHLRIQSMRGGYDLLSVLEDVQVIERKLSKYLAFSFSPEYGYLTACPTNLGTGLRISVLIHLPALVLTKEIQKVIRSTGQLGMTVRGFRGEGSDVVGNLFQISNR